MTKTQAWVIIQDQLMRLRKPTDYDELGLAKFFISDDERNHKLQIVHGDHLIVEVEYERERVPKWS